MPTPRSSLPDALAGLSIAGLLLPEAVAYSGLAGLPPQAGVIALFAGLVCYGLLGRSRYAIVTATSSSAAVLASRDPRPGRRRSRHAHRLRLDTRAAGTGMAFLVSGALRLGAMSSLIARPVLRGYSSGLALVIVVKQWPTLLAAAGALRQLPAACCGAGAPSRCLEPAEPRRGHGRARWRCSVLERMARRARALVVIVASIAASTHSPRTAYRSSARSPRRSPHPPSASAARGALAAAGGVLAAR